MVVLVWPTAPATVIHPEFFLPPWNKGDGFEGQVPLE
jgi:hypothetical protein